MKKKKKKFSRSLSNRLGFGCLDGGNVELDLVSRGRWAQVVCEDS